MRVHKNWSLRTNFAAACFGGSFICFFGFIYNLLFRKGGASVLSSSLSPTAETVLLLLLSAALAIVTALVIRSEKRPENES
jgi:uncharacterized membrane protein